MKHKVDNAGDFESCENPGCRWGATWSMGMICNTCHKQTVACKCPCPLTDAYHLKVKKKQGERGELELGSYMLYCVPKDATESEKMYAAYNYGKKQQFNDIYEMMQKKDDYCHDCLSGALGCTTCNGTGRVPFDFKQYMKNRRRFGR